MGGRKSTDYTRCPGCKHRTVLFHWGSDGDYLKCTRCDFGPHRYPEGWEKSDIEDIIRWKTINGIPLEDE